ncbi:MAG: hypothetical protein EOP53_07190 [Sphingobacteriales bacterium]|nr:MAG: hypothetical protein EOP53_07190 [Sphingobacteriales bacterium]
MAEIFEDNCVRITIENDIIYGVILSENLTLSCAKKMVKHRRNLTKDIEYATLVDITRLKSVTKEARDYLAEGEAVEYLCATAFYTNSVISEMAANFFISYNKPNLPARIFNNKVEALAWLREIKVK